MSRQYFLLLLGPIIAGVCFVSVVTLCNNVLAEPPLQSEDLESTIQPEVEFKPRLDIENETEQDQADESEEDQGEEDTVEEPEKPTPVPAKAFKDFFGYNQQFTDICRELTTDGRNLPFYQLVLAHADDYKYSCAACRALLKSFEVPCKPKKIKSPKAKKGEPPPATPTPIPRQREPHPELINLISSLFGELSRNTKSGDEMARAIRELDRLIAAQSWSNTAEKEYFAAFSEAIKMPFLNKIRQLEKIEKKSDENRQPVSQEVKKKELDALF